MLKLTVVRSFIWVALLVAGMQAMQVKVYVTTGGVDGAGTDANVYLTIFGDKGQTKEKKLDKFWTNEFQRGATDYFKLDIKDVGTITKIRVREDNTLLYPDWFLKKIIIKTTKTYTFLCKCWLKKGNLMVELVPENPARLQPSEVVAKCNQPLGMENGKIPNEHITASSEWNPNHGPTNARLNFQPAGGKTGAWSAKTNDLNQWLKVDFGALTKVTAIKTQGRQGNAQWVTEYSISYSQDDVLYQDYTQNGQKKVFPGNTDSNTIVRQGLSPPVVARYVRIHPKSWYRHISMRVEFLGCPAVVQCNQPLGMENGKIPNEHITASSEWNPNHGPTNARLNFQPAGGKTGAWSAKTNDLNQWLKVDFGALTKVTAMKTQGRQGNAQWVTEYSISYSQDDVLYQDYTQNGQKKVFPGNADSNTIVRQGLSPPVVARYVRIHPTSWYQHISMRVEFLGCPAAPVGRIATSPSPSGSTSATSPATSPTSGSSTVASGPTASPTTGPTSGSSTEASGPTPTGSTGATSPKTGPTSGSSTEASGPTPTVNTGATSPKTGPTSGSSTEASGPTPTVNTGATSPKTGPTSGSSTEASGPTPTVNTGATSPKTGPTSGSSTEASGPTPTVNTGTTSPKTGPTSGSSTEASGPTPTGSTAATSPKTGPTSGSSTEASGPTPTVNTGATSPKTGPTSGSSTEASGPTPTGSTGATSPKTGPTSGSSTEASGPTPTGSTGATSPKTGPTSGSSTEASGPTPTGSTGATSPKTGPTSGSSTEASGPTPTGSTGATSPTTGPTSGSSTSGTTSGPTQSTPVVPTESPAVFAESLLRFINFFRRLHGIPPVLLSNEMSKALASPASKAVKKNGVGKSQGSITCSLGNRQDLARNCAVNWYSHVANYDWAEPKLSPQVTPFTQLVWKSSARVGISLTPAANGKFTVVAEFNPPQEQETIKENVLPLADIYESSAEATTCPQGYRPLGRYCFAYRAKAVTWETAVSECAREKATLASVQSRQEEDLIRFMLQENKASGAWLGLHDRLVEGRYLWVDGSPVPFIEWSQGEPNGDTEENCVEQNNKLSYGGWADRKCSDKIPFICKVALPGSISYNVTLRVEEDSSDIVSYARSLTPNVSPPAQTSAEVIQGLVSNLFQGANLVVPPSVGYSASGTSFVVVYLTVGPNSDPNILQKLQKRLEANNFTLSGSTNFNVHIVHIDIIKSAGGCAVSCINSCQPTCPTSCCSQNAQQGYNYGGGYPYTAPAPMPQQGAMPYPMRYPAMQQQPLPYPAVQPQPLPYPAMQQQPLPYPAVQPLPMPHNPQICPTSCRHAPPANCPAYCARSCCRRRRRFRF